MPKCCDDGYNHPSLEIIKEDEIPHNFWFLLDTKSDEFHIQSPTVTPNWNKSERDWLSGNKFDSFNKFDFPRFEEREFPNFVKKGSNSTSLARCHLEPVFNNFFNPLLNPKIVHVSVY